MFKLSMNGEVEVLFDFAFVVYTGPDPERIEGLIAGKPVMKRGVPVMVLKKDATKLIRYPFYQPFEPMPSDVTYNIDTEVNAVHIDYPVTEEVLIIPEPDAPIDVEYNVTNDLEIAGLELVIAQEKEKPKQTRVRRKEVKPRKPRTKRNAV